MMTTTSNMEENMTKIDLGGPTDSTISNNSLSSQALNTAPQTTLFDPVKPKPCVQGSKLALLVTVLALLALLICGVLGAVFIFGDVFNDEPNRIDNFYEYDDDADDKGSDEDLYDAFISPKDFLFRVDLKSAANNKVNELLRLVDGNTKSEGRLEVFYNGEWGTICDDKFNRNAADVACRQLGFTGAISYHPWAYFGQGSGRIWLDNVRCTGQEPDLDYCSHRPWGIHNCVHYEDVGVTCIPNDPTEEQVEVRLAGGNSDKQGRVEVKYNGAWGTVCDDAWRDEDAKVICRQLGLPYQNAIAVSNAYFGQGSGQILLDNVNCQGNEAHVGECRHQAWGSHNCRHYEDAGVICGDGSESLQVRLVGGSVPNEGRVEVLLGGIWGSVCDDSWGVNDANVVCRQLGYTGTGHESFGVAHFGEGSGPILMDEVSCSGNEVSLGKCDFGGWTLHDCSHYEDAGVRCVADSSVPDQTAPVITCPANQPTSGVINAVAGQSATVNFPDATATDVNGLGQSTIPSVSYTIQTSPIQTTQQSSGQFPIGITFVQATAGDDSGNTASCSFAVTVTESNEPVTEPPASGPWEELAQECGRPSIDSRIVNGQSVNDIRTWPWAAYITNGYFCGAELISHNWAVTASHCLDGVNSATTITLGRLNQYENAASTHRTRVQTFIHPSYNPSTTDNDIALLKLDNPVEFSDYVRPVCLATTSNEYAVYSSCHVIGWGNLQAGGSSPDVLQEVASPLITQSACRQAYGQSQITDNMICTSTATSSGSCQGDSGGPMMCKNSDGVWDLVGVTSWGYGCANSRYPDVLARVSRYQSWIRSIIDANGGP